MLRRGLEQDPTTPTARPKLGSQDRGEFMRSRRWQGWIGLFLCALVSVQSVSRADEAADFKKHYDSALTYYNKGAYADALREFQMAYAIKQLPKLLLNIGQLHRKQGNAKEALGYYELYLRVEPNPEPKLKAELDRYILQTRSMLDAAERVRAESLAAQRRSEREREQDRPGADEAQEAPHAAGNPPPSPAMGSAATPHVPESGSASGRTTGPATSPATGPATGPAQGPSMASRGAVQAAPSVTAATPAPPEASAGTRPALLSPAPPPASPPTPLYKRGWFWGVLLTAAALTAGGVTAGVMLAPHPVSLPDNIEIQNFSLRGAQ